MALLLSRGRVETFFRKEPHLQAAAGTAPAGRRRWRRACGLRARKRALRTTMPVGFIGNDDARQAWREREGRGPFRQIRVDPGGGDGQQLPRAPPMQYAPQWNISMAVQDPEHWHERLRQLRDHGPQGTAISHEALVHVPRSRLQYLIRPGLREQALAKERAHAVWRDHPTRFLCQEQLHRVQLRASHKAADAAASMGTLLPPLPHRGAVGGEGGDWMMRTTQDIEAFERTHLREDFTPTPKASRLRSSRGGASRDSPHAPTRGSQRQRVLVEGERMTSTAPPITEHAAAAAAASYSTAAGVPGGGLTFTFSSNPGQTMVSEVDLAGLPVLPDGVASGVGGDAAWRRGRMEPDPVRRVPRPTREF